jgi:hypothetical protein
MAQNFLVKQQNYLQRLSPAVVAFLAANDALQLLATEFSNDAYGSGGANALTDATVQTVLPAADAALVFSAVGALANANAILATVAANRQSLEMMRP